MQVNTSISNYNQYDSRVYLDQNRTLRDMSRSSLKGSEGPSPQKHLWTHRFEYSQEKSMAPLHLSERLNIKDHVSQNFLDSFKKSSSRYRSKNSSTGPEHKAPQNKFKLREPSELDRQLIHCSTQQKILLQLQEGQKKYLDTLTCRQKPSLGKGLMPRSSRNLGQFFESQDSHESMENTRKNIEKKRKVLRRISTNFSSQGKKAKPSTSPQKTAVQSVSSQKYEYTEVSNCLFNKLYVEEVIDNILCYMSLILQYRSQKPKFQNAVVTQLNKTPLLVEFFTETDQQGQRGLIHNLQIDDILKKVTSFSCHTQGKLIIKEERPKYKDLITDLQHFQNGLARIAANTTILKTLESKKESVEAPLARCINAQQLLLKQNKYEALRHFNADVQKNRLDQYMFIKRDMVSPEILDFARFSRRHGKFNNVNQASIFKYQKLNEINNELFKRNQSIQCPLDKLFG